MPRWYDRAVDELENQRANGELSNDEFWAEMRELNAELRDAADEEAERARNDYLGGW